jgi:hypothetical protein
MSGRRSSDLPNAQLAQILNKLGGLMAQIDDLKAQIVALQTAQAANAATLTQLGTDIAVSIADLQAKIAAAGTPIDLTQQITDLTALAAQATAMGTSLGAIDTSSKGL